MLPDLLECFDDESLISCDERNTLGPTGGNVGQNQRMDNTTRHRSTAVRHQIGLHISRIRIFPVPRSSNRNASPQQSGTDSSSAACPGYLFAWFR